MKKTALLIDAGWFLKGLADQISVKWPSAKQVCTSAKSHDPEENWVKKFEQAGLENLPS